MPDNEPQVTRQARVEAILDATLKKIANRIETGPISSSLLREIVQLAKAAGVRRVQVIARCTCIRWKEETEQTHSG